MVATNINWTEAPFSAGGWMVAKSEAELREFLKDYDVTVTSVGPELDGGMRIYDFKLAEKQNKDC